MIRRVAAAGRPKVSSTPLLEERVEEDEGELLSSILPARSTSCRTNPSAYHTEMYKCA